MYRANYNNIFVIIWSGVDECINSGVGKSINIGGRQLELQARAIAYRCTLLNTGPAQGHGWGGSSPNKVELNCCVLCIIQHYDD